MREKYIMSTFFIVVDTDCTTSLSFPVPALFLLLSISTVGKKKKKKTPPVKKEKRGSVSSYFTMIMVVSHTKHSIKYDHGCRLCYKLVLPPSI